MGNKLQAKKRIGFLAASDKASERPVSDGKATIPIFVRVNVLLFSKIKVEAGYL